MATKGPAPKPTALTKLEGNPGKRPFTKNEPQPAQPDRIPNAPKHLNADAKRLWRSIIRELCPTGVYTNVDLQSFSMLCESLALYWSAVDNIQANGAVQVAESGYQMQSAWVGIRNNSLKQAQSLMSEFGMTPSSRSRLSLPDREKEADPFAAYEKQFSNSERSEERYY